MKIVKTLMIGGLLAASVGAHAHTYKYFLKNDTSPITLELATMYYQIAAKKLYYIHDSIYLQGYGVGKEMAVQLSREPSSASVYITKISNGDSEKVYCDPETYYGDGSEIKECQDSQVLMPIAAGGFFVSDRVTPFIQYYYPFVTFKNINDDGIYIDINNLIK